MAQVVQSGNCSGCVLRRFVDDRTPCPHSPAASVGMVIRPVAVDVSAARVASTTSRLRGHHRISVGTDTSLPSRRHLDERYEQRISESSWIRPNPSNEHWNVLASRGDLIR